MSKNEKVTENKEQTEQKVMTKYDRKVQKRKEEKEKEKKEERISTADGVLYSGYILSEIEMDFNPDRMIGSLMIKLRGAE